MIPKGHTDITSTSNDTSSGYKIDFHQSFHPILIKEQSHCIEDLIKYSINIPLKDKVQGSNPCGGTKLLNENERILSR